MQVIKLVCPQHSNRQAESRGHIFHTDMMSENIWNGYKELGVRVEKIDLFLTHETQNHSSKYFYRPPPC